jgi:dUTP pyrophosphatase
MKKVNVKFKKFHNKASIPKRATELAGGWDVKVTEVIRKSDDFYVCKLGFGLQIPENYKITLVPRSSLTKTKWVLQNSPGLGDADFIGEYQLKFRCIPSDVYVGNYGVNLIYDAFPFEVGDSVGQIYIEEVIDMEFEEVEQLDQTERGEGGYGSTDNKQ